MTFSQFYLFLFFITSKNFSQYETFFPIFVIYQINGKLIN